MNLVTVQVRKSHSRCELTLRRHTTFGRELLALVALVSFVFVGVARGEDTLKEIKQKQEDLRTGTVVKALSELNKYIQNTQAKADLLRDFW